MQYWTCPDCGANLDPGEKCDCQNENNKPSETFKEVNKNVRNQNHSSGNIRSNQQSC